MLTIKCNGSIRIEGSGVLQDIDIISTEGIVLTGHIELEGNSNVTAYGNLED